MQGLKFPRVKWADLPHTATSVGHAFYCPNAPMGPSLVVSDGSLWRAFARGIYNGRVTLTAAMNGIATFTYVTPFPALPTLAVSLVDTSGTNRLTYSITAESISGCTVKVDRGQVLPSVLATLLGGFNPFIGGASAGIVVNLTAFPTS